MLFNKSLAKGCFPSELKKAVVRPLLKKDGTTDLCLICHSFLSKLLDKVMQKRLQEFWDSNNLMPETEAGMVREWVAGKAVWSPCYHKPYLSALAIGSSHNRALYKCPITTLLTAIVSITALKLLWWRYTTTCSWLLMKVMSRLCVCLIWPLDRCLWHGRPRPPDVLTWMSVWSMWCCPAAVQFISVRQILLCTSGICSRPPIVYSLRTCRRWLRHTMLTYTRMLTTLSCICSVAGGRGWWLVITCAYSCHHVIRSQLEEARLY